MRFGEPGAGLRIGRKDADIEATLLGEIGVGTEDGAIEGADDGSFPGAVHAGGVEVVADGVGFEVGEGDDGIGEVGDDAFAVVGGDGLGGGEGVGQKGVVIQTADEASYDEVVVGVVFDVEVSRCRLSVLDGHWRDSRLAGYFTGRGF